MSPIEQLNPMQRYLVEEFVEDYEDGLLSRRDMISRVLHITGGVAATATMLTSLGIQAAGAQGTAPASPPSGSRSPVSVPEGDPRVVTASLSFAGANGSSIIAYQATPAETSGGPPALVLVCHENRGLVEHIRDVTRRVATEGYLACAVDLLSAQGGTEAIADPAEIPALLSGGDPYRHVAAFQSAIEHYRVSGEADMARIGMTGFCFGGGITWRAATRIAELRAAVPWYGPPPPLEDVPTIQAAMLGIYSDDPNDGANRGRDELEAALQDAGVTHRFNIYPDTQHAFHNDTGQRYNQEQALVAWNDMLAWFGQYLGTHTATPVATPES
jgi:carboxymethylenebutenolidase